jgi:hypothetical protein
MLKPKSNALRVVEATPGKVTEVMKPVSKIYYPHSEVMVRNELPLGIQ